MLARHIHPAVAKQVTLDRKAPAEAYVLAAQPVQIASARYAAPLLSLLRVALRDQSGPVSADPLALHPNPAHRP